MGFDKNSVIGFSLLAVLFFGYFWYSSANQRASAEQRKHEQDSIAALKPVLDSAKWKAEAARMEKALDSQAAGDFALAGTLGNEAFTYIENNIMRVTFSNKGGWIYKVALKKYKGPDSLPVTMGGSSSDQFNYDIITGANQSTSSDKLYFNPSVVNKAPDGTQTISYQVAAADGKSITHSFVVKPDDYMVDIRIDLKGADKMVSQQALNVHWKSHARRQQFDVTYEKQQTKLVYFTDDNYDFNTAAKGTTQELSKPTGWIGLKQQFFNSTLLATGNFTQVKAEVIAAEDTVKESVANLVMHGRIALPAGNVVSIPLKMYQGPNDYYGLRKYNNGMFNIVDLGSGMFAFVKYINRWLILPVFEFLTGLMGGSLGWAILLLTFIIRLLIAPLTYSSYLSGAKMKALKPEIDALKKKVGDDQQAMSVEQMKLFREAGVNPLGGCIPALFQIPIFFALFSLFNSNIDLRGVPFLWATDLSSYDSILNFGFEIPFYGNHVSLFTITACITSFGISMYTMTTTPDNSNPALKYMPYIFPFVMLFIFNKMPSALTWYYTVSNAITLILQFVIQTYIIDHTKVLSQIQANKAKPKTKSKWQERMEAMQATQQKVEDMKKKSQVTKRK